MAVSPHAGGTFSHKSPVKSGRSLWAMLAVMAFAVIAGFTVRYFENRDAGGAASGDGDSPAAVQPGATFEPETTIPEATPSPTQAPDYRGADLSSKNFNGDDLAGVSFEGADLTGATFKNAVVKGAIFDGADLTKAKFVRAVAVGASFRGAVLSETVFRYANLKDIDLSDAKIDHVNFGYANGVDIDMVVKAFEARGPRLGDILYTNRVMVDEPGWKTLRSVCRGSGTIPDAAPYNGAGGFSPMVLAFLGDPPISWGGRLARSWEPMSTRYLQLVACVKEMPPVKVESCGTYSGGGTSHEMWRGHERVVLSIVVARTGEVLYTQEVLGSDVDGCPYEVSFWDNWTITGEDPPFGPVKDTLSAYAGTPPK